MNDKIPVKNNTQQTMFIGGVMIPPDETRHPAAHHVPEHLRPRPVAAVEPAPTADEVLLDLLDHRIAEIVEALPALDDDEVDALERAEQAGKTRSGLMKAFHEEKLRRANRRVDLDNYTGQLAALDLEELRMEREAVEDDADKSRIVDEMIRAHEAET